MPCLNNNLNNKINIDRSFSRINSRIIIATLEYQGIPTDRRSYMATYQEILNQIESLKQQAEEARRQEMAGAIGEIKRLMAQFGISPADLGFTGRGGKTKGKGATLAAKYRDPVSGKTWSGRGRRPAWVMELEAQGKHLDDFKA